MGVTIVPVPLSTWTQVYMLEGGDWVADCPEGPWHHIIGVDLVSEELIIGLDEVTAQRIPAPSDAGVYRLDPQHRPTRY